MELKNLKVNTLDPFLTAEKWNETIEYSENFEGIISAVLGKKFKGIYKPHLTYYVNDYVWYDGKCYMITGENQQRISSFQKESVKDPYYFNDSYLCLFGEKLATVKDGNTKILNEKRVSTMSYYDGKDFAIGSIGKEVYKLKFNGESERLNFVHEHNIIKTSQDDLYVYCLTEDKKIIKAETNNETSTYFENINPNTNHDLIDIIAGDVFIFVLTSNSDIHVFNKQTGGKISILPVNAYIENVTKAKITTSDKYSIALHDGDKTVNTFLFENGSIVHSSSKKFTTLTVSPSHFSYSNNRYTLLNDNVISSYLSSRYNLKETNLKMLINATSNIELNYAEFGVDFTKGQIVSVCKNKMTPVGYKTNKESVSNGIYNDGTNIVEIINGKGSLLNSTRKLKYPIPDTMINKIIFMEFENYTTDSSAKGIGYVSYSNRNAVSLRPSTKTMTKPFKCFIKITGTISGIICETFVFQDTLLVEKFTTLQAQKTNDSVLNFESEVGVSGLLKRVAIIEAQDMDIIDVLSTCSFNVPEQHSEGILPNSVVRTNEQGAITIRSSDDSLINSSSGVKVNSSADYNLNKSDVLLNTIGSKALKDQITSIGDSLVGYSPVDHKHQFNELLNVPDATVSSKGIVQLSSSTSNDSETIGATSKAVKLAYEKASHGHPYSLDTHKHNFSEIQSIPNASLSTAGISKLSNAINSNSEIMAATPKAVMTAYEKANHSHPYAPTTHSHSAKDLPTGTTSAYGIVKLTNSHTGSEQDLAVTPFALKALGNSLIHEHDYIPTGGYFGSGQALQNDINTRVKYIPGHAFEGIHRGDGNSLYWKGPDTGWIRFWDSNVFNPNTKLNVSGGTISGNLTVNGTFRANNVTQASDIRLKSEIKEIKDPLDSLMKLNGYSYVLNSSGEKDMGVIAQELEEVFPELVVTNEDGMKSVKYNSLLGVLIEAVKELKRQVDAK